MPKLTVHPRCLSAIPIQFQEDRGWGAVTGELPFLGILIGAMLGLVANIMKFLSPHNVKIVKLSDPIHLATNFTCAALFPMATNPFQKRVSHP
jgi:hypothetical protein